MERGIGAFADRGDGVVIGPASCVDDTIASMVSTLLAWHEKHPGQQPDLTFPQTADGRTACSRDNNKIAGPDDSSESSTTSPTESTESSTTTTSETATTTTARRLRRGQRPNCQRTDLSSSSTMMLPLRRLHPSLSRKSRPPDSPSSRSPVVR